MSIVKGFPQGNYREATQRFFFKIERAIASTARCEPTGIIFNQHLLKFTKTKWKLGTYKLFDQCEKDTSWQINVFGSP